MDSNQDIFDFDLDPDLLISLLGKLSLDNIPNDVSDTLQSLENRNTASNTLNEPVENQTFIADIVEAPIDTSAKDKSDYSQSEENKRSFFASIGLVSGAHQTSKTPKSKSATYPHQDEETSDLWNFLASGSRECYREATHFPEKCLDGTCRQDNNPYRKAFDHLNAASESQSSSIDLSDDNSNSFSNVFSQGGRVLDIQLNDFHDNAEFYGPNLAFSQHSLPSDNASFHNVFKHDKILDVQLNDFSDNANFRQFRLPPVLSEDETTDNSLDSCHDASLIRHIDSSASSDKSKDSTEKSVNSPDSGYDTSPYSTTVSPQKLPDVDPKSSDTFSLCNDASDSELDSIFAAVVEVENLLYRIEIPETCVSVPVLKDALNPEDHKERLLNFLKEPMCKDVSPGNVAADPESSQSVPVSASGIGIDVSLMSPKAIKKSPSKSKKRKFSYETKYSVNNELQYSPSKDKPSTVRNKVVLPDTKRTRKKIKVFQLREKNLKRSASDDTENKIDKTKTVKPNIE